MAANLLDLAGVQPLYKIVPPPRRSPVPPADGFVRNFALDRARDAEDRRRAWLAALVVCVGVTVSAFALWQARVSRTVYVPVPTETLAVTERPAPTTVFSRGPVHVEGGVGGRPAAARQPAAGGALEWEELTLMLRAGLTDDDIIAATAARPLAASFGPAGENVLRTLGAGPRLIDDLRRRPSSTAPPAPVPASRMVVTASALPLTQVPTFSSSMPTPVDYAARDRKIQDLKTQIDALDEQVRCIRNNPKDSRYWWHYYGNSYGIDQAKRDAYLKELDQQRNDLRRQKWALEGR